MQNPILQTLGRSQQMPNNLGQIKQMMNMVKNAGNPQAMLNQMAQNNPHVKQIMDIVSQNGGDPKKAFYQMAEQKGINPDEILNMLKYF